MCIGLFCVVRKLGLTEYGVMITVAKSERNIGGFKFSVEP